MIARHVVLLAVLVAAALPVAALAADVPDESRITELSARLGSVRAVRVDGKFGTLDVERPILDATGLRSAAWDERARARPGLFVSGDAPAEAPRMLAWRDIDAIRVPRGSMSIGKGLVFGAITGAALGLLLVGTMNPRDTGEAAGWRAIGAFSGSLMGGAAIGAVLGSRRTWDTVYAAPAATTARETGR